MLILINAGLILVKQSFLPLTTDSSARRFHYYNVSKTKIMIQICCKIML